MREKALEWRGRLGRGNLSGLHPTAFLTACVGALVLQNQPWKQKQKREKQCPPLAAGKPTSGAHLAEAGRRIIPQFPRVSTAFAQ